MGVGGGKHPPSPHASQQLDRNPTHELPPLGALHLSAPFLIEHFVLPRASVVQQVTKPGLPHVDFAAHEITLPLHEFGSVPDPASVLATPRAHFTYWP